MKKDVAFIRKGGRVIPIRKRKKDKYLPEPKLGTAKVISGVSIASGGAYSGAKSLKKSFGLYSKFAGLRGASKLATKGSKTYSTLISKAAKTKISAIKSTNLARTKFGVALGLGTFLISSGVSDFFKPTSKIRDEISGAVGTAAGAGIVALTARKFGVKATALNELFTGFARQGQALTKSKIWRIAKTKATFKRPRSWGKPIVGKQLKFF